MEPKRLENITLIRVPTFPITFSDQHLRCAFSTDVFAPRVHRKPWFINVMREEDKSFVKLFVLLRVRILSKHICIHLKRSAI